MVLSGGKFIILIELIGADLSHIADILPQIILKAKYWFSLSKPNLNFNFPFTIFFFLRGRQVFRVQSRKAYHNVIGV